jgi:mersacidin/lichenicidin family type 2 lantibiotic
MSKQNIIRAWKDRAYRRGLSQAERALLPENPAGLIELTDAQLGAIDGGLRDAPTPACTQVDTVCSGAVMTEGW